MTLATRCPHCSTTFRVAHDQLKLHAGLVRCGVCEHTFNGIEQLIALPPERKDAQEPTAAETASTGVRDAPATLSASALEFDFGAPSARSTEPAPGDPGELGRLEEITLAIPRNEPALDDTVRLPHPAAPAQAAAPAEVADAVESDAEPSATSAEPPAEAHAETEDSEAPLQEEPVDAPEADWPEFEPRRSAGLGLLQGGCVLLLLVLLLLQGAWALRIPLMQSWPSSRAGFASACTLLGCHLTPPLLIRQISVDTNELQTLAPEHNLFQLSVQLQNTGPLAVAWPHLELVLLDSRGKAVLQRAFAPGEYLDDPRQLGNGLPAGAEHAIRLHFTLDTVKGASYKVGPFYP